MSLPTSRGSTTATTTKKVPETMIFGSEANVVSEKKSYVEVFKSGAFTGIAFSAVFIVSESIPIFMKDALPNWSASATRALSIAIWIPASMFLVFVLSVLL